MAELAPIDLDHRELDACTFALIDPLAGGEADVEAWAEFPQHALVPRGFEAQAAQLPKLVDLRSLPDGLRLRLVGWLLDGTSKPAAAACVALLQTGADANPMAMHLRNTLAPDFPGHRRGLLLFYDPVLFEHLAWMLPSVTFAGVLGPVMRWLLPLRGHWFVHKRPTEPGAQPLRFHAGAPVWQRIARIDAIHKVLQHDAGWRNAPAEWGPQAEALLIRAERHHLTDRDDAVAFAVQGLRCCADFDRHPRVRQLLADCAGHPVRYRRLTGAWNDADWQAIYADLHQTERRRIESTTNRSSQGVCR